MFGVEPTRGAPGARRCVVGPGRLTGPTLSSSPLHRAFGQPPKFVHRMAVPEPGSSEECSERLPQNSVGGTAVDGY